MIQIAEIQKAVEVLEFAPPDTPEWTMRANKALEARDKNEVIVAMDTHLATMEQVANRLKRRTRRAGQVLTTT